MNPLFPFPLPPLLGRHEAAVGAELDRERGWTDADGEPTGHGAALAGLAFALRREIFGPPGSE